MIATAVLDRRLLLIRLGERRIQLIIMAVGEGITILVVVAEAADRMFLLRRRGQVEIRSLEVMNRLMIRAIMIVDKKGCLLGDQGQEGEVDCLVVREVQGIRWFDELCALEFESLGMEWDGFDLWIAYILGLANWWEHGVGFGGVIICFRSGVANAWF